MRSDQRSAVSGQRLTDRKPVHGRCVMEAVAPRAGLDLQAAANRLASLPDIGQVMIKNGYLLIDATLDQAETISAHLASTTDRKPVRGRCVR